MHLLHSFNNIHFNILFHLAIPLSKLKKKGEEC